MSTPTTTVETIRDKMITVIEALTPSTESKETFRVSLDEIDFREWASKYKGAVFRRFSILDVTDYENVRVSDGLVEQIDAVLEVVVAYPKSRSKYGANGLRDAMDLIREDMHLIDDNVGLHGGANTVSGQCRAVKRSARIDMGDTDDTAILSVLELGVPFYRAVN